MVQYMGNTFKGKSDQVKVVDALERNAKNGSENLIRTGQLSTVNCPKLFYQTDFWQWDIGKVFEMFPM